MIKIARSADHFRHEEGWLSTQWHFSFDSYRDPANMGFGPLRVFNDDIIQPGKGFGLHPHRDMEIITYVIDGELEHRDDRGNKGVIRAGEVQRMTAGIGIVHSEYNHSKVKPVRLLQMWIHADRRGLEPSWEQQGFSKGERADRLLPVIAPDGAMRIHQDAAIYVSSLGAGKTVRHELRRGRKAYLFAIDGSAQVNGSALQTRDAARIEGEKAVTITAEKPAELLLIDLPGEFNVN
ncbi:MAG: pirin family protein [Nitrososphaera sp.]|uniref:pirin family protein n=1 Tax=Nitrososphaera sp. TaxID=1971748 RepID=UPI003D6E3D29